MQSKWRNLPILLFLGLVSLPLVVMCLFQVIDVFTVRAVGSLLPQGVTFEHFRFLWQPIDQGRAGFWPVLGNTLVFACATAFLVTALSVTSAYALSRLSFPGRRFFLAGLLVLHAFPTITLIIAIFLILQMLGLYDSLLGLILVKVALELPFGVWIMKGFYDTVPWEIEMAGVQDGAGRGYVWWALVLPQVQPGLMAILVFSFLSGWSEFILPLVIAPGSGAQVLATYMAALITDDTRPDFDLFKAVGLVYALPVVVLYLTFQKSLMNIYGGGSKG